MAPLSRPWDTYLYSLFRKAGTFCSLFLCIWLGFITIFAVVAGLLTEFAVDGVAGLGAIVLNSGAIDAGNWLILMAVNSRWSRGGKEERKKTRKGRFDKLESSICLFYSPLWLNDQIEKKLQFSFIPNQAIKPSQSLDKMGQYYNMMSKTLILAGLYAERTRIFTNQEKPCIHNALGRFAVL